MMYIICDRPSEYNDEISSYNGQGGEPIFVTDDQEKALEELQRLELAWIQDNELMYWCYSFDEIGLDEKMLDEYGIPDYENEERVLTTDKEKLLKLMDIIDIEPYHLFAFDIETQSTTFYNKKRKKFK